MKFSFPTAKEGYFEFGLEKNGFRNKKSKPATEKLVEELDVCTRYALLKIEEPTPSEEKALFLMEKILLLHRENALYPKVAKGLFESM